MLPLFGRKPDIQVPINYDVMMKCKCTTCQVQADSACTKPKIAARNEMLQHPDLSKILSPGMMKNIDLLKDVKVGYGGIRGMSKEQMKQMSDQLTQNAPKEQISMPKPEDMPGPYCGIGVAACNDLDFTKMCLCSGCQVFKDFNLSKGKPVTYYCRDGNAK